MKKKGIWGALLFVSIVIILSYNVYHINKSISVHLIAVKSGAIQEKVYANGQIEPVHVYAQYAMLSGRVEQVKVHEGDKVVKGQVLTTLATEDLARQLQVENNNLLILQAAKKDKQQQFEDSFTAFKKQRLISVDADMPKKPDYTSDDLRIANEQLTIENIKKQISESEIAAQGDGIVTALSITEGQMISQGLQIVTITDTDHLQVKGYLNQLDVSKVKISMDASITGDAFANTYSGTVTYLAPIASKLSGSSGDPVVEIHMAVAHPAQELLPGYNATIEIPLPGKPQLLVPQTAVSHEGDQAYVYEMKDGIAKKVQVQTG
ncbi:MAG: hypothetical protein A2189_02715, partial [Paenibacillus sp. RIFOXYA1_FULL_44_5]